MKKNFIISVFVLTLFLTGSLLAGPAYGQSRLKNGSKNLSKLGQPAAPSASVFVEDFDYPAGSLLTAHGWAAHSVPGTNPITVTSPGLSYTGYAGANVGQAVSLTISGEDVNKSFSPQTAGSVYTAFMVNVSDAAIDAVGGYFIHLGPDPIGSTFRGRIFIKKDASNKIAFGLSKAATDATVAFTPFSYDLNTTYLLVMKYTIISGATNDTIDLIVNPTLPGAEPAATISATDISATDINPGTIALRQGSNATSPTLKVDGIRVATSWDDVINSTGTAAQHVFDFDGDGKTDYGVIRRVFTGVAGFRWYTLFNATGTEAEVPWGLNDDFPAAGDYDGDGITDYTIWRQASGTDSGYYILRSSDNTVQYVNFGLAGDDTTVVGDYTGDGIDDPAIYRPGATASDPSQFAYYASSGQYMNRIVIITWGVGGDFALPGDFDGDGVADYCLIRSINGGTGVALIVAHGVGSGGIRPDVTYTQFGTPTDYFVPGDYDGDGKTDFAVTRLNNGSVNWYILPSSGGPYYGFPWGLEGDVEVQGDYDGDGKTDVAVWRPGQGAQDPSVFYVLRSSGGVGVKYWGIGTDVPTAVNSH